MKFKLLKLLAISLALNSCGQINDMGVDAIDNLTESGVKINKEIDTVTGTLAKDSRAATKSTQKALEEIRLAAADQPEYQTVIDDNDALMEEICIEHDERIMTKEEFEDFCY